MRCDRPIIQNRHAGYSLIEMVIAIAIISMLMTVSATLFAALSRSEGNVLRSATSQQTLARLNELFRRDVHQSLSATISEGDDGRPQLMLQQADGGSVRYAVAVGTLERTANVDGTVHRESFRIADAEWSFKVSDNSRRVELTLRRPADTVTQVSPELLPMRTLSITAVMSLTPSQISAAGGAP